MGRIGACTFVLAAALAQGCSIEHRVSEDYGSYLANNAEESQLPAANLAVNYRLTDRTVQYVSEIRSAMAGYANLWIVDFGKILEETLRSPPVQASFAHLQPASADKDGLPELIFDLESYQFEDLGAHISLNVTLVRNGQTVLDRDYQADGATQGGKMFWGGPFAMRNAIQQSTRLAMHEIFVALIADLNATVVQG